eukprot:Skav223561  [mRNA]  locus=scaffold2197:100291:101856:+ [translate_table: standard]
MDNLECVWIFQADPQLAPQASKERKSPVHPPSQPFVQPERLYHQVAEGQNNLATCRFLGGVSQDDISSLIYCMTTFLRQDLPASLIEDLPPSILDSLSNLGTASDLSAYRRFLIYTDGSSRPGQWHCEPKSQDPKDPSFTPDGWSFLVLGERNSADDGHPCLDLLGWQAGCVDYQGARHIGTNRVGSFHAEKEALIWAHLWRLGQDHKLATCFVSDSSSALQLTQGQTSISADDRPGRILRGLHQAACAAVETNGVRCHHTPGHAGDPWNEIADRLVKLAVRHRLSPALEGFDVEVWQQKSMTLWMATSQTVDCPRWTDQGFQDNFPQLPPEAPEPAVGVAETSYMQIDFHLSFASANVCTMYRGHAGFAGKLAYLQEQFAGYGLNFVGVQESRTPQASYAKPPFMRVCTGHDKGQGGLELWINLQQPYARATDRSFFLSPRDVAIVHSDAQLLLVHIVALHLDLWVAVGHAPHSGHDPATRSHWWHHLHSVLDKQGRPQHLVVLIDANATTGPAEGMHIL